MVSIRGIAAALLLSSSCNALHVSKRAQLDSVDVASDDDVTMPFCVYGEEGSFNGTVQVFIGEDNSRSLAFGNDDIGTQTSTKCKGDIPEFCRGGRAQKLGYVQSCEMLSCPCKPDNSQMEFPEQKRMMDIAVPLCNEARNFKSLLIGLGGAAIPEYLLEHCPDGTGIESVEFDPRVVKAATNFFGLNLAPGINEVENNDGGLAAQERAEAGKLYDVTMVDCFQSSGYVPDSCRNEKLAENMHKILKPGGKFIHHIWASQLDSTVATYRGVFGNTSVVTQDAELGVSWLIISTKPSTAAPFD